MTLSVYCAPFLPPAPPVRLPNTTTLLHAEWNPWFGRRSPDEPVPTCGSATANQLLICGVRCPHIDYEFRSHLVHHDTFMP